jgi:hypothetical protein
MIVKEKVYVPSPSDFTITVGNFKDSDGNDIDVVNSYVRFLFYDNTGASYECIHDPFEGKSRNTKLTDGNLLVLYIENYHLKSGELRYRVEISNKDSEFPDSENSIFTKLSLSGIILE